MKTNAGFTLIEVLIALAILTIALTAIMKTTSQNIKDNTYIQNKTIANWVATETINEARLGLLKLPESPGKHEEEKEMLNKKWLVQGTTERTANPKINKIIVEVYTTAESEKLASLTSFNYVP